MGLIGKPLYLLTLDNIVHHSAISLPPLPNGSVISAFDSNIGLSASDLVVRLMGILAL